MFAYYKMCRETLRLLCVALLVSLNIIIAKKLQIAKVFFLPFFDLLKQTLGARRLHAFRAVWRRNPKLDADAKP